MLKKITHLTSVHSRYDTRIFMKMCSSLAKCNLKNYEVYLVVADGVGDEVNNDVNIIDAGKKIGGRFSRMTKTVDSVYRKALDLDSDIYHLHDPELIPIGIKLKKKGKKVIFDAHEDFPKQLLSKSYLNPIVRRVLSGVAALYESYACRQFDAVVSATPFIADKFKKINSNSIAINNFPIIEELSRDVDWSHREDVVCYVGGISKIRGIREVVQAMNDTKNVSLALVGTFGESGLESEVKSYEGWVNVNQLGFLNRDQVASVFSKSKAGIVTFLPEPNHIDSQPNKMFEYMSSGLPIITSNFPLWRSIVEGCDCGICVDPSDPNAIAAAITYINTHPKEAETMGKNGKKAVLEKYNWTIEEVKLFKLYEEVMV